jgi:uncharacterized cofD-like protein
MDKVLGAKIVVIGGGTGSFVVLSGLKNYASDITALVNMADDGGSTGQLRDELGVLPPGDVRQCLVALSESPRVRDLFNYRFEEGTLEGHAFGNLFLTALEKMTGDFAKAVELAEEVLRVNGKVMPTTLDSVVLCAKIGRKLIEGEFQLGHMDFQGEKQPKIFLKKRKGQKIITGNVKANPQAIEAIMKADMVVVAPGNLYGSLAPALLIDGIGDALRKTDARTVYISNLVTKPGQTDNFTVTDFAAEVERLAGTAFLDYVIYNVHQPSKKLLEMYAADGELPVQIDSAKLKEAHFQAKGAELLAGEVWSGGGKGDKIAKTRTFIRHDPDAVARAIMKIYFS